LGGGAVAVFLVLAVGVDVVLALLRWKTFWSTPDGVYAMTAREVAHGGALYDDIAAAQPPLLYLFGAAELLISDTLTALRVGLELVQIATASLVLVAVWRLTRHRWLAVAAGVVTPLLPITLTQHALLTPETLAAPCLLGSALLASRATRRASYGAGALACLAVACKLAFLIPALAIAAGGAARRRMASALTASLLVLAVAATLVFGSALWTSIVTAQFQTGTQSLHDLGGLWAQAAWNLAPLVGLALAGAALRERSLDGGLARTLLAGAAGSLCLGVSIVKLGSYVNVLAIAEPFLLIFGAAGGLWLWRQVKSGHPAPAAARAAIACGLLAVFGAAQTLSTITSPSDPWLATRPFAASGPREIMSRARVTAAAVSASHCPPEAPYPGIAFIAFVAHRRVPGDQPDMFILSVPANRRLALRAAADRGPCPTKVPVVDSRGEVTEAQFAGQ